MIATFQELSIRPQDVTLLATFAAGTAASLGLCALVRLPIVAAYVAGVARCKRHGVILSILFAAGLVVGTALLGITAAPADTGFRGILYVNKYLHWGLGASLFVVGVLLSGVIDPQLLPGRWQGVARHLVKAGSPGAFLLGCAFGLLQTPACSHCGPAIQILVRMVGEGTLLHGLILLTGFGAGQGITMLSVGALTSLLMPDLLRNVRSRLCSVEHRIQLLAGNVLMVLGIYFVIIS